MTDDEKVGAVVSKNCPDCKVKSGEFHEPDCDLQSCPLCGYKILTCDCVKDNDYDSEVKSLGGYIAWNGELVGYAEAAEYGFWFKFALTLTGHTYKPCEAGDKGARIDVRSLARVVRECRWDKVQRRWVRRPESPESA